MVKDDWIPPRYCIDQNLTHVLSSDLAWAWWKMIELHPGTAETRISPKMFYIQI